MVLQTERLLMLELMVGCQTGLVSGNNMVMIQVLGVVISVWVNHAMRHTSTYETSTLLLEVKLAQDGTKAAVDSTYNKLNVGYELSRKVFQGAIGGFSLPVQYRG
jgi:hypothetical protein